MAILSSTNNSNDNTGSANTSKQDISTTTSSSAVEVLLSLVVNSSDSLLLNRDSSSSSSTSSSSASATSTCNSSSSSSCDSDDSDSSSSDDDDRGNNTNHDEYFISRSIRDQLEERHRSRWQLLASMRRQMQIRTESREQQQQQHLTIQRQQKNNDNNNNNNANDDDNIQDVVSFHQSSSNSSSSIPSLFLPYHHHHHHAIPTSSRSRHISNSNPVILLSSSYSTTTTSSSRGLLPSFSRSQHLQRNSSTASSSSTGSSVHSPTVDVTCRDGADARRLGERLQNERYIKTIQELTFRGFVKTAATNNSNHSFLSSASSPSFRTLDEIRPLLAAIETAPNLRKLSWLYGGNIQYQSRLLRAIYNNKAIEHVHLSFKSIPEKPQQQQTILLLFQLLTRNDRPIKTLTIHGVRDMNPVKINYENGMIKKLEFRLTSNESEHIMIDTLRQLQHHRTMIEVQKLTINCYHKKMSVAQAQAIEEYMLHVHNEQQQQQNHRVVETIQFDYCEFIGANASAISKHLFRGLLCMFSNNRNNNTNNNNIVFTNCQFDIESTNLLLDILFRQNNTNPTTNHHKNNPFVSSSSSSFLRNNNNTTTIRISDRTKFLHRTVSSVLAEMIVLSSSTKNGGIATPTTTSSSNNNNNNNKLVVDVSEFHSCLDITELLQPLSSFSSTSSSSSNNTLECLHVRLADDMIYRHNNNNNNNNNNNRWNHHHYVGTGTSNSMSYNNGSVPVSRIASILPSIYGLRKLIFHLEGKQQLCYESICIVTEAMEQNYSIIDMELYSPIGNTHHNNTSNHSNNTLFLLKQQHQHPEQNLPNVLSSKITSILQRNHCIQQWLLRENNNNNNTNTKNLMDNGTGNNDCYLFPNIISSLVVSSTKRLSDGGNNEDEKNQNNTNAVSVLFRGLLMRNDQIGLQSTFESTTHSHTNTH